MLLCCVVCVCVVDVCWCGFLGLRVLLCCWFGLNWLVLCVGVFVGCVRLLLCLACCVLFAFCSVSVCWLCAGVLFLEVRVCVVVCFGV